MSAHTFVLGCLLALNSCLLWAKMTAKAPSPVNFETNHPAQLAFWIASEYGAIALHPLPSRKQRAAIALDHQLGIDQLQP